jgi:WD40 repeat protein
MSAATTATIDKGPVFDLGAHAVGAAFVGDVVLFGTGDGDVVGATRRGGIEGRDRVTDAGILFATPIPGGGLLVASDDGVVRAVDLDKAVDRAETGGKWPTALAAGRDGMIAVAAGRAVLAVVPGKPDFLQEAPSLVQGLAFAAKGARLAAAHYGGATLYAPAEKKSEPVRHEWKGAHLDVTISPDGGFLVTSMQENALHGWKLREKGHMRMSGYPAKTRSMSWSADGKWLATSGAEAAILWPFLTKDGPMGKAPNEVAARAGVLVSRVAYHPSAEVLATGYADGVVTLTRLSDGAELEVAGPGGGQLTTLVWSGDGGLLAWGTEEGRAGLFPARQGR